MSTELKDKIAVMQAALEGKRIEEIDGNSNGGWKPQPCPSWDWVNNCYRIKPDPEPIRITSPRGDGYEIRPDGAYYCNAEYTAEYPTMTLGFIDRLKEAADKVRE